MMKQIISILISLIVLSFNVKANNPWILKKNSFLFSFNFNFIPGIDRIHKQDFKTKYLNRKISDYNFDLYFEYSVTDKISLHIKLPFKYVISSNQVSDLSAVNFNSTILPPDSLFNSGELFDLGNINLGIRYNIINKKVLLTIGFEINAPSNTDKISYYLNGLRTAYPCWSFSPIIYTGGSQKKYYWHLNSGLSFRTNNYSSYIRSNFETGFIFNKFIFAFNFDFVYMVTEGNDDPEYNLPMVSSLYINNQNYFALTLKGIIHITERWKINLSVGGGIWANNIQQGPSIGLGFFYKFT